MGARSANGEEEIARWARWTNTDIPTVVLAAFQAIEDSRMKRRDRNVEITNHHYVVNLSPMESE